MRFYVNDQLLLTAKDTHTPIWDRLLRSTHVGNQVNYKNFRIYRIVPSSPSNIGTPHAPANLRMIGIDPQ